VNTDGPDLPRDPADYRPRPLMGLGFWALIAFGVLCVLAGVGVATLAPRLLPASPPPPVKAAPPPAPAATPAPPAAEASAATTAEIARLNARIAALETQGARSTEAAATALAAAALVQASQGSRPFANELAALHGANAGLPEVASLTRLAVAGAPSRAALAASFPDYAARAVRRAHKPTEGAGVGERIAYLASKVVTVRRVDEIAGRTPDAVLARAELALHEGEVVQALHDLDMLPPAARDALAPWRAQAERRAEIDRDAAALSARALHELAAQEPVG